MRKTLSLIFAIAFLSAVITGVSFAKDHGKQGGNQGGNKGGNQGGNTVSQAAHTAKSEGLKGEDLAGRVHEAIDVRKESKDVSKGKTATGTYYYRGNNWYTRDATGNETVADLVTGAITGSLPPHHRTVVYQDTPYYYDNRYYYQQLPDGNYVVVEPPRR